MDHISNMVMQDSQRDSTGGFVPQIVPVTDCQRLQAAEQRIRLIEGSERLSKTLLDSISHEIRIPISAITSAAVILDEARDPSLKKVPWAMVDEIQEATRRLNRLVGNLLDMARLEPGHVKPRLDWCDVTDLVQVTLREIAREMVRHKVTTKIANGLPLVLIDFALMQQALGNLLLNAAAHTPPGTSVRVLVGVQNDMLALVVEDTGPGLPADALPFIFNKFYRAPSAPAGGTGLGLAIVKGFVEAQGGMVQATNRPEGGATFTVYLPIMEVPPISGENLMAEIGGP
jgi:two-component system sensor histidine kinase KdpD